MDFLLGVAGEGDSSNEARLTSTNSSTNGKAIKKMTAQQITRADRLSPAAQFKS